jgi:hypothetical protein
MQSWDRGDARSTSKIQQHRSKQYRPNQHPLDKFQNSFSEVGYLSTGVPVALHKVQTISAMVKAMIRLSGKGGLRETKRTLLEMGEDVRI